MIIKLNSFRMKKVCFAFLFIISSSFLLHSQIDNPSIIINEINDKNIQNDDFFIELLITGNSLNPCDQQIGPVNIVI